MIAYVLIALTLVVGILLVSVAIKLDRIGDLLFDISFSLQRMEEK